MSCIDTIPTILVLLFYALKVLLWHTLQSFCYQGFWMKGTFEMTVGWCQRHPSHITCCLNRSDYIEYYFDDSSSTESLIRYIHDMLEFMHWGITMGFWVWIRSKHDEFWEWLLTIYLVDRSIIYQNLWTKQCLTSLQHSQQYSYMTVVQKKAWLLFLNVVL